MRLTTQSEQAPTSSHVTMSRIMRVLGSHPQIGHSTDSAETMFLHAGHLRKTMTASLTYDTVF
jgi:hypothetical protein